ncbi:MAG: Uma2 family endonuclease [Roseiflexaceae bacterium]|nr:Uma2 family endonuclease [Roseiflexaceae bacterium]
MAVPALLRQFTVDDYARMREAGILTEDDRVELIEGAIYRMSPIGPLHMAIVNRLNRLLLPAAGDDAIVSVQNSVRLSDDTEVQPDIAVLRPHPGDYEETLPRAQDVLLIIEVADTSLDYDRTVKLPLYAQAAIVEVWIIDARQQAVEQYTRPAEGQYTQVQTYRSGSILRAETLPQIEIAVDRLFPSRP